jgi:hypothetical protein
MIDESARPDRPRPSRATGEHIMLRILLYAAFVGSLIWAMDKDPTAVLSAVVALSALAITSKP